MFKGNSKLELNEATLVVAVQEYFDRRIREEHSTVVKSIRAGSLSPNSANTFVVELGEAPQKDTP